MYQLHVSMSLIFNLWISAMNKVWASYELQSYVFELGMSIWAEAAYEDWGLSWGRGERREEGGGMRRTGQDWS